MLDFNPRIEYCVRHALKARINSRDALADALEASYKKLKHHINTQENDLDQDIKARWRVQHSQYNSALILCQVTHIPDHLQFLVRKVHTLCMTPYPRMSLAFLEPTTLACDDRDCKVLH